MRIAVLTFDGFNEIDSFVVSAMLNRVQREGWKAEITSPTPTVASMNGVIVERQQPLAFARAADVVVVGSGRATREAVADPRIMDELRFDPARQIIASQCSGALVLAKLGHLRDIPACTDLITKPWVIEAGVRVADQPFFAAGNVATAGGCLASHYPRDVDPGTDRRTRGRRRGPRLCDAGRPARRLGGARLRDD